MKILIFLSEGGQELLNHQLSDCFIINIRDFFWFWNSPLPPQQWNTTIQSSLRYLNNVENNRLNKRANTLHQLKHDSLVSLPSKLSCITIHVSYLMKPAETNS